MTQQRGRFDQPVLIMASEGKIGQATKCSASCGDGIDSSQHMN